MLVVQATQRYVGRQVFVVSPLELGLAFLVTLIAATVQGTVGFGFAVLSVPLLSLVDTRMAPVPQLLLSLPLCIWVAWRERESVKLGEVGWILAGRLPGAAIGVWLLYTLSQVWLDGLVAGVVMLAVLVMASGRQLARNPYTKFSTGVVSGTFALLASIGGPPLALLYRDAKGPVLRANLAAVFVIGLTITIAARVLASAIVVSDVILAAWLLPAVLLGAYASGPLGSRVEGAVLRRAVLVIASLAAVGLMWRAVAS
jgi:uncharacterized membrane protein YfcA